MEKGGKDGCLRVPFPPPLLFPFVVVIYSYRASNHFADLQILAHMKLKSLSDLHQILPESAEPARVIAKGEHDGKGKTVRIFLETKGRKGKSVTIVSGLQHNPTTMKEIARMLKELCGTGGTVKDGNIELQGDRRVRATEELRKMNYVVA